MSLVLSYMGLPLQLYVCSVPLITEMVANKLLLFQLRQGTQSCSKTCSAVSDPWQGALFGPYTPLQQLDVLADYGTKSYIVGSTNSLLLQQKDRYSDILINVRLTST